MYIQSDRILRAIDTYKNKEEKLLAAGRAYIWLNEALRHEKNPEARARLRLLVAWIIGLRLGMMM